jgi:YegS/Rv2252/BmrU family lipid kinase
MAERRRRLLIIHNPTAGGRRRRRYLATLAALARHPCDVVVRETAVKGDAEAFARESRHRFDAIVAAGGDGTINEVANGIGDSHTPVGVIPLGTANVLAAEVSLPDAPEAVAAILARGAPRAVHTGLVNNRRFLMMAGIGFDARVVQRVNPGLKRRIGKGAYLWRALQDLATCALPHFRVEVDGVPMPAESLVVAKGRSYGGPFVLAHGASLAEPTFEVCLLPSARPRALLTVAGALGLGLANRVAALQHVPARELVIYGPAGEPVQADGDVVCRLPAVVRPAATPLMLLAP